MRPVFRLDWALPDAAVRAFTSLLCRADTSISCCAVTSELCCADTSILCWKGVGKNSVCGQSVKSDRFEKGGNGAHYRNGSALAQTVKATDREDAPGQSPPEPAR